MKRVATREIASPTGETPDGRTRQGRRYETLIEELSLAYGADVQKSLVVRLKIRSAAALVVRLEEAQSAAAAGAAFDPSALAQLNDLTVKALAAAAPPDPRLLKF